jgi:hypothetical protein
MSIDPNYDEHLDVCQLIETGLKMEYEKNESLTDNKTIFGIEMAKVAIKQAFGYAKNQPISDESNIRGIIDRCVAIGKERIGKINGLTLDAYVQRLEKIKRSVNRHSKSDIRGY